MKNTMEGRTRRWMEHWRRDFDASQDGQRREDAEKGLWLVGAAGRRAGGRRCRARQLPNPCTSVSEGPFVMATRSSVRSPSLLLPPSRRPRRRRHPRRPLAPLGCLLVPAPPTGPSLSLRARRPRRPRLHHRHRRPHDRHVPLITSAFQPVLQSLIVTRPPTGSFLRRSLPHTLAVLSPFLHHAHLTPPPSPPRRYRLHPWP